MKSLWLIGGLLLAMFQVPLARADVWVGGDNNCQFQNIQDALDLLANGSEHVVKIANSVNNQTYDENLILNMANAQDSLTVQGGYDTCEGTLVQTPAIIDGGGTGPVMVITGNGAGKTLVLKDLVIKNGFYDTNTEYAGGLNVLSAGLTVFLRDLTINQNTGIRGGGLYAQGVNQRLNLYDVNIVNNNAQNGGGLACDFGLVFVFEGSAISFNSANSGLAGEGNGGGIYANFDCQVGMYAGESSVAGLQGVVGNQASGHGGGVYLGNSAELFTARIGNTHESVIKDNQADANNDGDGFGGAVYATGVDSTAHISQGLFTGNSAANGGAFAAENDALMRIFPSGTSCQNRQPCTRITGNAAGAGVSGSQVGLGGAFYATTGAYMRVVRSEIQEHHADNGVVAAVSSAGTVSFASSVISDNGGGALPGLSDNYLMVSVDDDSQVFMGSVTMANNSFNESVLLVAFGGVVDLRSSLVLEPGSDILESFNDSGQAVVSRFTCSLLHETQTIAGATVNSLNIQSDTDDFEDSANRDYRLTQGSPAIDMCGGSTSWTRDYDGQVWGYDDPNVANIGGSVDAGADEYYTSDIIFMNNFD
jgi:predicted outer membrane repeat protein